jgi:hypothetical protein
MHYDNGIQLYLPYSDQLSFNCEGIVCVKPTETTEAPTETPTDPPIETTEEETASTAAETTASPDTEGTSDTVPTVGGCQAFAATGAALLSVLLSLSACVMRRRED